MNFPKQFLISKKIIAIPGFVTEKLWDDYYLYYHKDFHFFVENKAALFGVAWQTADGKAAPEMCLSSPEDILEEETSWCGRYVLFVGNRVYTDLSALLSVYYSETGISSNCALLAFAMGLPEARYEREGELNWLPAPCTPYKEIKRLLPSQVYNFSSGVAEPRQLLPNLQQYSERDLKTEICNRFSISLNNLRKMFPNKRLMLGLTGGHDSRTLLALLEYSGVEYECYTQDYEGIPQDDLDLPLKLCEVVKRKHCQIPLEKNNFCQERWERYSAFTSQLAQDADQKYYAYGQFEKWTKDVILLRSSIWESVVEYYYSFIPDKIDLQYISKEYGLKDGMLAKKSMQEYINWKQEFPENSGLSFANQYYLDQRAGSWLASIEGGFDLLEDCLSLQPLNCRELLALILQFDPKQRVKKLHQEQIVAFACPQIFSIPYCNDDSGKTKFEILTKRLIKGIRRIRKTGLRGTWKYYLYKK